MESPVRGARTQSGITSAQPRNLELRWLENRNCGCECGRNSRPSRPPGTEVFDAETGRRRAGHNQTDHEMVSGTQRILHVGHRAWHETGPTEGKGQKTQTHFE